MELLAGFAEVDVTPPIGTWMGGYAFRPQGCIGVHDPLYARAAVFTSAGKTIAILSIDLIGLDADVVEAVRSGIEKWAGIPPAAVMLNASHTHGGPLTKAFRAMGSRNPVYLRWLTGELINLVTRAHGAMGYASLSHGRAPAQIGVNRREYGGPGQATRIGVNPTGPVMPWVDAIVVRSPWERRGPPRAVLFSHACHPTCVGGDNLEVTADFCGYACHTIREELGGEVMPLFLQGCSGNINPHGRGDFGWAKKHGTTLGQATLTAIRHSSPLDSNRIDFAESVLDLPLEDPPSVEDCEREAIRWDREADQWRASGDVGKRMNAEGMRDQALFECEAAQFIGDEGFYTLMTIQRLSLGDVQIIGAPAELFVQYALDFDKQASGPVLTLGCSNGVLGYIPVAADYPQGGYEVRGAHRYYGVLPFDSSCEQALRRAAYQLLDIPDVDLRPLTI